MDRRTTTFALGTLAFALALAPAVEAANTGSGTFRMDKIKSTFSSACGFRVANPETPGAAKSVVVLSSVKLDCAALDTGFDPLTAADNAVKAASGAIVRLGLSPGGESIDGSWNSYEPFDTFGFGGQGEVKLTKNSATRVEGTYRTTKPEDFFDKTFEFDLKFGVDLLAGAITGTPIAAGGGEPGKVYQAYLKAIAKKDQKALRPLLTAAEAESLLGPGGEFVIDLKSEMALKSAKVTGGLQKGDRVALDIEGVDKDGAKFRGQVFLVQEGGAWKYANESLRMVFD